MSNPFWKESFGPFLPETEAVAFGNLEQLTEKLAANGLGLLGGIEFRTPKSLRLGILRGVRKNPSGDFRPAVGTQAVSRPTAS